MANRMMRWLVRGAAPGRWLAAVAFACFSIVIVAGSGSTLRPAVAAEVNIDTLVDMVTAHHGVEALSVVSNLAVERGGWGPAPGDEVVFEASLPWWVRGSVLSADTLPPDCGIPLGPLTDVSHCAPIDVEEERHVRFGRALFMNDCGTNAPVPRASVDDVLATYIEEMGHSWQEYYYETEGRGEGPRTRQTLWEDANRLIAGREYQIKAYVLSLSDLLPDLSREERARLAADICEPDGYANPLGHVVPCEGPPPGWPNPSGWPVTAPTPEALAEFCAAQRS